GERQPGNSGDWPGAIPGKALIDGAHCQTMRKSMSPRLDRAEPGFGRERTGRILSGPSLGSAWPMPPPTRPTGSFRFSIADIPVPQRHRVIGSLRERGLLPIEPLQDDAVTLSIAKRFLPGASILSGTLCGVRQEGAGQASDAKDDLFLGVNLMGRSVARQRGREAAFGDGEGVLLSLAEGCFTCLRPTPAKIL